MKRIINIGTLIIVLLGASLTSCDNAVNEAGSFKVRMTDAPADYAALNLTVTGVDVYLENQGWINLSSETQNVNILSLTNGAEITLANQTNVKAGLYTRARVTFGATGTIQLASGGGSANISWAGNVHQVEIVIHEEVNAQSGADILLDFDVAESVIESAGQYIIEPAVTVVSDASTGVQGQVSGAANAAVILTNGANTFSTYISAAGGFIIRGVDPGTYTLTVFEPGTLQGTSFDNVVITQGELNSMGVIQL